MMTLYMKNNILNNWFRGIEYSIPTALYLGFSHTEPSSDGTNVTEPSVETYKRLEILSNEENWTSPTNGSTSNDVTLRFPQAIDDWTTKSNPVNYYVIFDNLKEGNLLFYGQLEHSQQIPAGSILEIPINGLVTSILDN